MESKIKATLGNDITVAQLDAIGQLTLESISIERKGDRILIKIENTSTPQIKSEPTVTVGGKTYAVKEIC